MTAFVQLALFIALMLLIATVFVQYQILQDPTAERLQNRQRLLVWWVILVLCTIVFRLGLWAICLLVCALLTWSVVELHTLLRQSMNRRAQVCLAAVLAIFSFGVFSNIPAGFVLFVLAIANAALAFQLSARSSLSLVAYCAYFSFSLFSILLLAQLAANQNIDFAYLLLILFFITSLNDIAQYVSGSNFGSTRIAPSLSPNKTVAGLVGGVVTSSIAAALLLPAFMSVSILHGLAIGGIVAVTGFLGDLLISKLKRGLHVKDSGNSIAGHGGILDRLDSLMLTAPVLGLVLKLGGQI